MHHLISIDSLSVDTINHLLEKAQNIIHNKQHLIDTSTLKDRIVVNLFFEPSTRTRVSFEIAAKRIGAHVINFNFEYSSAVKGEIFIDTIKNLEAMGIDYFVIRHKQDYIYDEIIPYLKPKTKIINAGDGCHEHPTQALLDMLTIKQHKRNFAELTIAIVGDIKHSRVAHSNIFALQKLNAHEIRLVGPSSFLEDIPGTQKYDDLDAGISGADVIIFLRIQKERMQNTDTPDLNHYVRKYGLTKNRLSQLKHDAIIMHPGPINRNVEIADEVMNDKRCVILQQVSNGIAVRMAVLLELD